MPEPYDGAPRRKGPSPLAWVGLGCAVVIGGGIAFVVFVFIIVFGALRSSTPYQEATARARQDPRVIAALGQPIETALFFAGSVNTKNRDGDADLNVGLSGPKGKARLIVIGTKTAGVWRYSTMRVEPENGAPIDLLTASESPGASPAGSPDTTPPAA